MTRVGCVREVCVCAILLIEGVVSSGRRRCEGDLDPVLWKVVVEVVAPACVVGPHVSGWHLLSQVFHFCLRFFLGMHFPGISDEFSLSLLTQPKDWLVYHRMYFFPVCRPERSHCIIAIMIWFDSPILDHHLISPLRSITVGSIQHKFATCWVMLMLT
jgi:hypothetical protein